MVVLLHWNMHNNFGEYNPAGRASVTYYTGTDVLIPLGFGLSYTEFKYSDLSFNKCCKKW